MLFSLNKMVNRLSPAAILGKGKESYLTGVGAENRNTTELRNRYRNCKKVGVKWIAMYVRTMSEVKGDFVVDVKIQVASIYDKVAKRKRYYI